MSERLPVPRFDPSGRAPGFSADRRRRLLVLATGALVLALVVSSVANASRASLRCMGGELVAYQGRLLPVGEERIEGDKYPPLRMPSSTCEDEHFENLDAFETRYYELAFPGGEPTAPPERLPPESALDALEAMTELPANASKQLRERRRDLLKSIVDKKVEQARESQTEALQWIERARQAGVEPAVLRAAERSLGVPPTPSTSADEDTPGAGADADGGESNAAVTQPAPPAVRHL